MFAFVAQPRFGGSCFTVKVHDRQAHRVACFKGRECFGERCVVDDDHVVDGDDSVPRFEARFFRSGANDHASDVHAFLSRGELAGEATQQQQEDHGGENVGRWARSKHAQTLSSGRLQEFFGLRLGKGTERQWAELQQAEGAHPHAVTARQKAVAEFVDDQGHDEGQGAPSQGDHRVQAWDGHKFRGGRRFSGRALGDGKDKTEHHEEACEQHGADANPCGDFTVGPPKLPGLGYFFQ